MRSKFLVFGFSTALVTFSAISSPAGAQIADLGKIIAKKDRDAGAAVENAGKSSGTRKRAARPKAAARAKAPQTGEYSPDTEDPASVLDITPEVMTRFAAGVAAETAKRKESGARLTAARYDQAGATAGQFTARQYFVLKQRVTPFCQAVSKGAERPADTRLAYMPSEAIAITPNCRSLYPLLTALAAPAPQSTPAHSVTRKR